MNPSKALLILTLCLPAVAQDPTAKPHAFFDRTNLALFSVDALTRTLDAESTRANIENSCRCYVETSVPQSIAASTPKMYGYSLGIAAGIEGMAYLAHRTHHHKIERLLPLFDTLGDGREVLHNYSISGYLPPITPRIAKGSPSK